MGAIAYPLELYGDDVFTSTDLNRRGGEVLNQARLHPVTISRNNELFALLKRDQASRLIRTVHRLGDSIMLLAQVEACMRGDSPSPQYEWLTAFGKDDLQRLLSEVLGATVRAFNTDNTDWAEVGHLIHEWKESALVAQGGVLDRAMSRTESDARVDLPDPGCTGLP